jgi:hypothetical protein
MYKNEVVWAQTFGSAANDSCEDIAYDHVNDLIYAVGHTGGPTDIDITGGVGGAVDGLSIKLEASTGNILWTKPITGIFTGCDISADGKSLFISGLTSSANYNQAYHGGRSDVLVVSLDTVSGIWKWASLTGTNQSDWANDIVCQTDALYVAVGTTGSFFGNNNANAGSKDAVLLKLSAEDGTVIWASQFGGPGDEDIASLAYLIDNNSIYITGSTSAGFLDYSSDNSTDFFLASFNVTDGRMIFYMFGGAIGLDSSSHLVIDNEINTAIYGGKWNNTAGLVQYFTGKIN